MATQPFLEHRRSDSGRHALLPSIRHSSVSTNVDERVIHAYGDVQPTRRSILRWFLEWTFGRGTVIWNIWPAVLLYTCFASGVTYASLRTKFYLGVPPVLITVLGVVIGFVIAYRASSGYDRYWMGRCCWSDLVRTSRTLGRLIWFHVPPRLGPANPASTCNVQMECSDAKVDAGGEGFDHDDEAAKVREKEKREKEEMLMVMREKRIALDLVEGFVVALKHHLRGEIGIYYDDLYHLVRPLHDHESHIDTKSKINPIGPSNAVVGSNAPPRKQTTLDQATLPTFRNPIIPAINSYGTFTNQSASKAGSGNEEIATAIRPRHRLPHRLESVTKHTSRSSSSSSGPNDHSMHPHPPLLSPKHAPARTMRLVSTDLIPFHSVFPACIGAVRGVIKWLHTSTASHTQPEAHSSIEGAPPIPPPPHLDLISDISAHTTTKHLDDSEWKSQGRKHRPKVAGGGQNIPLEVLRCLSEWLSVLEGRGVVAGNPIGGMYGCLVTFEDSLSALERILTTPLPFVYSAHLRHAVWIYLFLLPFQLVDQFRWFTIPGVAIATFFYVGFLAAGEEIEQPFGYDDNDLDLDLFCREIIHADIEVLKRTPCANAFIPDGNILQGRGIVDVAWSN